MSDPKRAEPNEHAITEALRVLRLAQDICRDYGVEDHIYTIEAAAAEIERLQSRIWEIQNYPSILPDATLRPGFAPTNPPKVIGYDVMVDGKPIASLKPEDAPHAAEIERLELVVERLWARRERDWLPIESAPRDGTRVELWFEGAVPHATFGHFEGSWRADDGYVYDIEPTHWRREPAGPSASPPLPSG